MTPTDHRAHDGVLRRTDYDFHADADKQLGGGEESMEEDEAFEPEVNASCIAAAADGWVLLAVCPLNHVSVRCCCCCSVPQLNALRVTQYVHDPHPYV